MHRALIAVVGLAVAAGACASEVDERVEEARTATQQFMKTLKGELQGAMKAGGPVEAIRVCSERAPAIARDLSQETGWEIGRTSLKVRNADNAPDAWERRVLRSFERRAAAGESPKGMEHHEVVETGEGQAFRYMKAIPTQELCLTCHGTHLSEDVTAALNRLYPGDEARGYEVGDIRGAFTILQSLPPTDD